MVVLEGVRMTAVGLVLGLAGALALSRLLASLLYGVGPRDPVTYAAVAALLAAVTLLACWLPARRASRVDPLAAIRAE
jgi:ABC-type antimicrobial peptide transport system permease subunit